MPFVLRNSAGKILAVSECCVDGINEEIAQDDQQLAGFLSELEGDSHRLAGTDLDFIRVLEDVIELLISQNTIHFTDLPAAAQKKMLQRQRLRDSFNHRLNLLSDDGEELL